MSFIKSSPVTHIIIALVFLVSGLTVNLLQLLFFIVLWPLHKELFRKINYYFSYIIYSELVFLSDWWAGVQYYFYVDKDDYNNYFGKEHAIFIINHKYEIDWLTAWVVNDRIGGILGMLLYAEGTRFTKEKQEASIKFARTKGLPELKEHLLPRTKGFSIGLPHFRHNLPAVYNVQIAFRREEKPSLRALLNGQRLEAHVYIERIPIEQVPENDKECDKWMYELYEKKDKMMVSFFNTGDWFKESGVKPLEKFVPPLRYYSLINIILWSILILVPFFYFTFNVLISGNLLHILMLMVPLGLLYVILSKLMSVSEIGKTSSEYGTDKKKTK
ncbi:1-acyl-sn-glycerol-3-phosphate acyltransferase delta-like isoform X2 [Aphis gossypii]|uniref:1-acyl-sn-glycerol-3-phosphate acyltransferase delta-like isoform X2 n=1 Tax=Aphis gossypii TaxID=80765 RepID=UPI002158A653|nr:1-acyl-sn-glycerol-3-phosphate acyltransferase delta-like isoform X2 [Aphis gossypii]